MMVVKKATFFMEFIFIVALPLQSNNWSYQTFPFREYFQGQFKQTQALQKQPLGFSGVLIL